jgi:hypothetical protein
MVELMLVDTVMVYNVQMLQRVILDLEVKVLELL